MGQSQITIQDYLGLTNKAGSGTIWGDIASLISVETLKNDEVLGNIFNRKKTQTADTFTYEYQYIPPVKRYDKTSTDAPFIKMEKITMIWGDEDWLETGYTIDIRTVRSMEEWGAVLGRREANMFVSKNDIDNLIALGTVSDYAIATGRWKLVPNLDTAGATKEQIYEDLTKTLETIAAIHIAKTDVGYGQSKKRSQLIVSEFVQIQMMKAANFISASDSSFNVFKGGVLGQYGGVPYNTSIYLDREDALNTTDNAYKTFDFRNILGVVFDIDNFTLYTKPFTYVGDGGMSMWKSVPGATNLLMRKIIWKSMGVITPAREHLNYLFVRQHPTLAQVNAARTRLRALQPDFYKSFTDIAEAKYNQIVANATNPRWVGGSDTPQDGIPPTRNAAKLGNQDTSDRRAQKEIQKEQDRVAKEEIKKYK